MLKSYLGIWFICNGCLDTTNTEIIEIWTDNADMERYYCHCDQYGD